MAKRPKLTDLMPEAGRDLLSSGGKEFVERIGVEAVREVVHAVLCGENLRDSTESLTRRRLALSNGALLLMFLQGCRDVENFVQTLPRLAEEEFQKTRKQEDRWILQWILGLTNKAVQNVLRDDPENLAKYRSEYEQTLNGTVQSCNDLFGALSGNLEVSTNLKANMDWRFIIQLLVAVGAQTLTLRGSDKSIYGKLLERLILGCLLHALDFKFVDPDTNTDFNKVFWLSSRGERRESDATAIYELGKGVRFDIGFIGRGNPEITLDKVSRFEREMEYGRSKHYMATFIIVDRVGPGSRIINLAEQIDGSVIQMSMTFWPQDVSRKLEEKLGMKHELANMPIAQIYTYLKTKVQDAPIEEFI